MRNEEKFIDCAGFSVCYSDETNGAGLETRFDFLNTIKKTFPGRTFKHCYEWCSGPSFFGYSLLAAGICERLYVADIFEPALVQAKKTAELNKVLDRVTIQHSNNWDNIPHTEKFDLIVGNPPHFNLQNYYNELWSYDKRIYIDKDWETHRNFFAGAKEHLTQNGEILLLECAWGSGVNTFQEMINSAGLRVAQHFLGDFRHDTLGKPVYYLNVKHK